MSHDPERIETLLARHSAEIASDDELRELADLIAAEPLAARRFAELAWQEFCLIDELQRQPAPVAPTDGVARHRSARLPRTPIRLRFPSWVGAVLAAGLALYLGLFLSAPRQRASAPPAELAQVTEIAAGEDNGAVLAQISHDGVTMPLTVGTRLAPGDRLEATRSRIQLRYPGEGTELSVQPGSILGCASDAVGKVVTIERGRVVATVAKQPSGSTMRFRTASAEALVVGTRLAVSIGTDGARLDVQEGLVRFRTLAGEAATDDAGLAVAAGTSALLPPSAARPQLLPIQAMPLTIWRAASENRSANTSDNLSWELIDEHGAPAFLRLAGQADPQERYAWFSVQFPAQDWSLATGLQLRIRGQGNGNTWTVEIDDGQPVEHFVQRFVDDQAAWRDVYLPFNAFVRRSASYQHRDAPDDGLGLARMSGYSLITEARASHLDIAAAYAVIH
jgi:Carbohydrate binding domain (family 11)/FecR protein